MWASPALVKPCALTNVGSDAVCGALGGGTDAAAREAWLPQSGGKGAAGGAAALRGDSAPAGCCQVCSLQAYGGSVLLLASGWGRWEGPCMLQRTTPQP